MPKAIAEISPPEPKARPAKTNFDISAKLKAQAAAQTAADPSGGLRDAKGRFLVKPPWFVPNKPGEVRNPDGKGGLYQKCRKLCREASPKAAAAIIGLIDTDDERVRYMAASWVHEQAWGKAPPYDPNAEKPAGPEFNPRDYSPAQLDIIEAALKLLVNPPKKAAPEIIPPESE